MKNYNRTRVFIAACLAMFIFGVMMTMLGSILPSIFEKYGLTSIDAGSLFLFMTSGMLAGSMVFGPIVDRFGYKILMIASAAVILCGLEFIAAASTIGIVKLSLVLIGFGGGVINGGGNALVADIAEEKSADLSLLGVFFGLGAFSVPFVLGSLLSVFSYEAIIAGIGFLIAIPLVFFVVIAFPTPKHPQGMPIREGVGLLKNPRLVLLGLILFFESGMEIASGGWISSFITREFILSGDRAVVILSLYWLGMMGARIVLNKILKKAIPARVFITSVFIAFCGSVLLIGSGMIGVASAGVVLLGIGLAAAYPIILGYVGSMYPDISGTAFSVVFVMALIGGMVIPYGMGILGAYFGFRASFAVVSVSLVMQIALFVFYSRSAAKQA